MEVYALSCETPDTDAEFDGIERTIIRCKSGSLVCLPEYFIDGEERYSGVSLDEERFTRVADMASSNGVYIGCGMIEVADDGKHIAGVLIDNHGNLAGRQRKKNVTSFEKKSGILPGRAETGVIETEFGTVAFSLCKDQWYPDASVDAEILLHPRGFGLNDERFGMFYKNWLMLDRTTAMLKKAYLIGTTGAYGEGALTDIIDFEGSILAETSETRLLHAEADLDELRRYREGELESHLVPRF